MLGVEFVVVVAGILLGLQVDGWNEGRKEQRAERVYLERLGADVDEMIAANEPQERVHARLQSAFLILESLDRCSLAEEDRELFELAIVNHQGMSRIVTVRTTYDEMIASGALARLDDTKLKTAISSLYAEADAFQDIIQYFSADLGRASDIIWRSVSLSLQRDGPPANVGPPADGTGVEFEIGEVTQTVRYDFEELCANVPFRNAIVEVIDSNMDRLYVRRGLMERLEEVRALIEGALR